MRRRSLGATALAVAAMLALAACGGGRTDEADADTPGTTTSAGEVGLPQFGDLESPCGPGEPTTSPGQGVDASTITIGYGDDAGYQGSPGIGHEATDAVEAMIEWCNAQGGINGRTVVGRYYDAKITELGNVMTEACGQVFMLVGQFWALPETAETTRLGCGLPTVPGIVSGGALANAPLMVSPFPQPVDQYNVSGAAQLAEAYPEQVTKAAVLGAEFPNLQVVIQRFARTVTTVGWEWLGCDQGYPITGVADYRPYLQQLKDCGAEVVFTLDLRQGMKNILDAAAQIDFRPIWVNVASVYTEDLAAANTDGNADELYFSSSWVPLDHTPEGSANAAYVQLVEDAGGDVAYAGQVSTSAFLLWATAAKACGDDVTRDCVMAELKAIHEWDAGGLSTVQDPGANVVDGCGLVMEVEGTAFRQWSPAEVGAFECDPAWAVEVEPPVDAYALLRIGPDRLSHDILG